MDPFSVVTCVASVISLSNAIISTQYDILRAMRSSTERTGGLEKAIEIYKDLLKHLSIYFSDRSDTCARTLSLRSDDVSSCWQLVRSNEPQGWLTRDYISREGEDTKAFEETCASLMHCVQSDGLRTEPALWKLQRWITRLGEQSLLSVRMRLPKTIRRPSPAFLLASWVVTVLAVVAYYEAQPGDRHRTAFLLAGVFVATVVGAMEGSSADTIILTNMPWCITLGILMDALMYRLVSVKSRSSREKHSALRGGHDRETGKASLA